MKTPTSHRSNRRNGERAGCAHPVDASRVASMRARSQNPTPAATANHDHPCREPRLVREHEPARPNTTAAAAVTAAETCQPVPRSDVAIAAPAIASAATATPDQ